MPLDADNFSGIVGHQSHVSNPEHVEHLGSHTIIPQIFLESKPVVGFDRIDSIFLKLIGFQFIEQSIRSASLVTYLAHSAVTADPNCMLR